MMLANPFTKGVRDRWIGVIVTVASIALMTWMAGFIYRDLDEEISTLFSGMPEAMISMFGLVGDAGAAAIVISEMFNLIAPLALGGIAISMGVAAVAGEEKRGTFELLMAHPIRRTSAVGQKAGAIVVWTIAAAVLLWVTVAGVGVMLDLDLSGLDIVAASVHVAALSFFFGMFALAIGAWTGNAGPSSGLSSGVLLISWLAATLLPLTDRFGGWAKASPWYYFSGAQPLTAGVNGGHVALLGGLGVGLFAVALVGANRRDLKSGWTGGSLRDRLASNERLASVLTRLEGDGQPVGSVFTRTLASSRVIGIVTGAILVWMGILMGVLYNAIDDVLAQLSDVFPEQMMQVLGIGDMGTVEGWFNAELFSITAPAALLYVGIVLATRALAGEQDQGTMDLLMAAPVSRTKVVLQKAGAIVSVLIGVALSMGIGAWLGVLVGGIDLAIDHLFAITLHLIGLGVLFGTMTLLIGALTGRSRLTVALSTGIAFLTYVVNGFFAVSERFADWIRISPWYYYTGSDPLVNGVNWGHAGVLFGIAALFGVLAIWAFNRADVK